jgi:hypothetical protein
MRRFVIAVALASIVVPVLSSLDVSAQAPPARRITPEQTTGSKGQNVTVEGVATISDANSMLLPGIAVHLNSNGQRSAPFAGYIAAGDTYKFPDLRELDGRVISMTGVVEATNTIPIIRLTSPDQITIVN